MKKINYILIFFIVFSLYYHYIIKEGYWYKLEENDIFNNGINFDITDQNNTDVLLFDTLPILKNKASIGYKLEEKEVINLDFKEASSDFYIIICRENGDLLYSFHNPSRLYFSKNIKNTYLLDRDEKYLFFLRYRDSENKPIATILKDKIEEKNIKNSSITSSFIIADEEDLKIRFDNFCEKLRKELLEKDKIISDFYEGVEYKSFPSHEKGYYLNINLNNNKELFLVTLNRKKLWGLKDHHIEVNNSYNNIEIKSDNKSFFTYVFFNSNEENEIKLIERNHGLSNNSTTLPFRLFAINKI